MNIKFFTENRFVPILSSDIKDLDNVQIFCNGVGISFNENNNPHIFMHYLFQDSVWNISIKLSLFLRQSTYGSYDRNIRIDFRLGLIEIDSSWDNSTILQKYSRLRAYYDMTEIHKNYHRTFIIE